MLDRKNSITTEALMHYYSEIGTKRLFIFDFSCSTCSTRMTMSDREKRHFNRNVLCDQTNCDGKNRRTHAYGGNQKRKNRRITKKRRKPKQKIRKRLTTRRRKII